MSVHALPPPFAAGPHPLLDYFAHVWPALSVLAAVGGGDAGDPPEDDSAGGDGRAPDCLAPRHLRIGQRLYMGADGARVRRGERVEVLAVTGRNGRRRCLVAPLRPSGQGGSEWVTETVLCAQPPGGDGPGDPSP